MLAIIVSMVTGGGALAALWVSRKMPRRPPARDDDRPDLSWL